MSQVVTPVTEAAVTAAPRTECALNMAVSMPAFPSRLLSHRAIVELEAGECGLIVVRRRGFDPVSCRTDWVLFICPESDYRAEQPVRGEGWKETLCWCSMAYIV